MREILFRGKKIDDKEWFHGNLLKLNKKTYLVPQNTWFDYGRLKVMVEVDPETVGQYTGLTDKNGKQIFEGDLLNGFQYPFLNDNAHNYFAEVVWLENSPAFGLYTHKHPLSAVRGLNEGCDYMEDFDSSQWEIIGNIHDNPELLKGGAE